MLHRQIWAGSRGDIPDLSMDADRGLAHRNWQIKPGKEGSVVHNSAQPVDYDWAK